MSETAISQKLPYLRPLFIDMLLRSKLFFFNVQNLLGLYVHKFTSFYVKHLMKLYSTSFLQLELLLLI